MASVGYACLVVVRPERTSPAEMFRASVEQIADKLKEKRTKLNQNQA